MTVGAIGRLMGGLLGFGLIVAACGGTATKGKSNDTSSCTAGAKRCDGNKIKRCDDDGNGESVWETCAGSACQVQAGVPSCAPTMCVPGTGVCNGTVATKCNQDGSGAVPGGVDCSASGKYCGEGECRDTLCKPGTKSCRSGDVYQCAANGLSLTLSLTCGNDEVCSDELGTCLSRICTPNESVCFDEVATTCDSLGSSWLAKREDCTSQKKICADGHCQAQACSPSKLFCRNNKLYLCDAMGVFGSLERACEPNSEHCQESAGGLYASCAKNDCVAGRKICDGNTVKVCTPDNKFPSDGVDCKENEYCQDGQCHERDCTLGTRFCQNGDVYDCEVTGPKLSFPCESTAPCQVIAEQATDTKPNIDLVTCVPVACPPGQVGCVEDKIGSCNSEGASLSGETTDCAGSGQVCTTKMTCATTVTDQLGEDSQTEIVGDRYLGNVINVQSTRKLASLEMWLRLDAAHDVRFIVFEQVGNEFVSRAEATAPAGSGTAFVSSGPIGYELQAGKRYALGALVPANGVAQSGGQVFASFGQVIGSLAGDLSLSAGVDPASAFSAQSGIYMKVTTQAP